MSVKFYQLNCNNSNSIELVNIGFKTQGTCRASCFLSSLSQSLQKGHLNADISMERLDEAVSDIQTHVERRKLYTLMSWIPFTEANFVSRLIKQVKSQIEHRKQDLIKEKERQLTDLTILATNNATDCNQYFIASKRLEKLIDLASGNYENSKLESNQVRLFYGLGKNEVGYIGHNHLFLNSGGDSLVPFIVEFESTKKLMKILDPDPMNPDIHNYQTMVKGTYSNITKQDLFNALIQLK